MESLLAPQVAFRRLHRDVAQKELNLLQFPTGLMAKTGARPAKVVRRERTESHSPLLSVSRHPKSPWG
jgi:hypothetical protein